MFDRLPDRSLSLEEFEPRALLAGDIQFAEPLTLNAGTGVTTGNVHAVDVNGDAKLDLIVGSWNGPASVLLGNGDMTFGSKQIFRVKGGDGSSHGTRPADVDMDGDLDLATGSGCCGVFVVLNEGTNDGRWNGYGQLRSFDGRGGARAFGDFDGDSFPDLAVTRDASDSDIVSVLLNNDVLDGQWQGFAAPVDYFAGNFASDVAAGDFDNDDDLDLLVANDSGVAILLNSGSGQFADAVMYPDLGIVVGDLDSDGNLDTVSPQDDQFGLSLGNGDGTFSEPETFPSPGRTSQVVVEDFDNDGDLDLAATFWNDSNVYILANNGQGEFIEQDSLSTPRFGNQMATGDFDNDGLIDLVVGGRRTDVFVFPNVTQLPIASAGDANGDGVFDQLDIVAVLQSGKYLTGQPASFAEGDWNNDGLFDQLDIVSALAAGTYLEGSNPAIKANGTTGLGVPVDLPVTGAIAADRDGPYVGGVDQVMAGMKIDIVQVLQAGKYLTGQPADWTEGDWNGDGVFDQLDVIAVLATNGYL